MQKLMGMKVEGACFSLVTPSVCGYTYQCCVARRIHYVRTNMLDVKKVYNFIFAAI